MAFTSLQSSWSKPARVYTKSNIQHAAGAVTAIMAIENSTSKRVMSYAGSSIVAFHIEFAPRVSLLYALGL